jgi:hypothetical protein
MMGVITGHLALIAALTITIGILLVAWAVSNDGEER